MHRIASLWYKRIMDDARAFLDQMLAKRGHDYATLSRLIGRNPAYVQQYIHRGTPRVLAERDRRLIAEFLGVDEARLGGPERNLPPQSGGLVSVPMLDVDVAAGAGGAANAEAITGAHGFSPEWLSARGLKGKTLSIVRVIGDSMEPTLSSGNDLLVAHAPRMAGDGIYVLRMEDALLVKRLARTPDGRISVRSDNPAYPNYAGVAPDAVQIIGRAVWVGRDL